MPDIFSLDRYSIAHAVTVERRDGLFIETDPRQWAHAVEFLPASEVQAGDGPFVVEATVEVESGEFEMGALSVTGTTFLSSSIVGQGRHQIVLAIPALHRCRSIVVRNAAITTSMGRVTRLDTRRDPTSRLVVEGFDLSSPFGTSRRGFWDKNIFADVRRLAGADARVVFHVGAHYGDESSVYLKLFSNAVVHCFEPAADTFATLSQKLAGSSRARLHQVALGQECGVGAFHVNPLSETSSLFPFAAGAERYVGQATGGSGILGQPRHYLRL